MGVVVLLRRPPQFPHAKGHQSIIHTDRSTSWNLCSSSVRQRGLSSESGQNSASFFKRCKVISLVTFLHIDIYQIMPQSCDTYFTKRISKGCLTLGLNYLSAITLSTTALTIFSRASGSIFSSFAGAGSNGQLNAAVTIDMLYTSSVVHPRLKSLIGAFNP